MAMLGDFHTMPLSVTVSTSWSFFSAFSMYVCVVPKCWYSFTSKRNLFFCLHQTQTGSYDPMNPPAKSFSRTPLYAAEAPLSDTKKRTASSCT
jgi:hypothetical protein